MAAQQALTLARAGSIPAGPTMKDRFSRMARSKVDEELKKYATTTDAKIAWIRSVQLTDEEARRVLRKLEATRGSSNRQDTRL